MDLANGSKWIFDAARMIAVELSSDSTYENIDNGLFCHLGFKRRLMWKFVPIEDRSLSEEDMAATRLVFKNAWG